MKALCHLCIAMVAAASATAGIWAQGPSGDPPSMLPAGMFSTLGNQIVDQNQNPVRLSCVYWLGMNVKDGRFANQDGPFKGIQANIDAIAATGFNCVRVDFNNISLHDSGTPDFLANMDQLVAAAATANLRVIIDDHDNEGVRGTVPDVSCTAQQGNGLWYDLGGATDGTDGCKNAGHTTQESYQSDWVSIASRYARNDTVIGYDLWNEAIGSKGHSLWGGGSDRDIHLMYETVGSAMLSKDPGKLIFAECPLAIYDATTLYDGVTVGSAPWGDCTGVKNLPIIFKVNGKTIKDKVVYDVHLYANSVDDYNRIFGSSSSPAAIREMNKSFGFLVSQNIAPVWDGESGTGFQENPDDQEWAEMLVKYLNGELGAEGGPSFSGNQQGMGIAWMSWSTQFTNKGDDNLGILNADGSRVAAELRIVKPLLYYPRPKAAAKARPVPANKKAD